MLIAAGEKVTDDFLKFAVEHDLDDLAEVLKENGAALDVAAPKNRGQCVTLIDAALLARA